MNAMKPTPRYWQGEPPIACDVCLATIDDEFIDGALLTGPWARLCPACHRRWGAGLGMGRGQRYTRQADGMWLNTTGALPNLSPREFERIRQQWWEAKRRNSG